MKKIFEQTADRANQALGRPTRNKKPTIILGGIILYTILLGAFTQGPSVLAQTNPAVSLHLYAGLTISGTVGSNYVVQFAANLSQTTNWQTLTNLTLPSSPCLWMDTSTTL